MQCARQSHDGWVHDCPQAFLTKLLTVDLPGLIVLPKRLDINIPPAVTAVAEAAVGRDAVMRAVASAVLQVASRCQGMPHTEAPLLFCSPEDFFHHERHHHLTTAPGAAPQLHALLVGTCIAVNVQRHAMAVQADALEHALMAALPLGPQSAAGGVSLPDSFAGELQVRFTLDLAVSLPMPAL